MAMIQIETGDLRVGDTLRWPVYDGQQRLLLKRGAIIASARQLESLLLRGIYRSDADAVPEPVHAGKDVKDNSSPFDRLDDVMRRIPGLILAVTEGTPEAAGKILKLAEQLSELYARWPDAMLGAVHLCHEYDYTQCHPVHTGILSLMMARKLDFEADRIRSLVAAALTQNVAMVKLQQQLQKQEGPLTDAQRQAIRAHPVRTGIMLRQLGINDPVWLSAVEQHHERIDGAGYPRGLKGDQISPEAGIIGLADRYAAMVSARIYRDALVAKDVLKDFYLQKGQECDSGLTEAFISELGVFPPGSFVRLANGEVGVVVKRSRQSGLQPTVSAYIAPRGAPYPRPFARDCSIDNFHIRCHTPPDTSTPINLNTLWGL